MPAAIGRKPRRGSMLLALLAVLEAGLSCRPAGAQERSLIDPGEARLRRELRSLENRLETSPRGADVQLDRARRDLIRQSRGVDFSPDEARIDRSLDRLGRELRRRERAAPRPARPDLPRGGGGDGDLPRSYADEPRGDGLPRSFANEGRSVAPSGSNNLVAAARLLNRAELGSRRRAGGASPVGPRGGARVPRRGSSRTPVAERRARCRAGSRASSSGPRPRPGAPEGGPGLATVRQDRLGAGAKQHHRAGPATCPTSPACGPPCRAMSPRSPRSTRARFGTARRRSRSTRPTPRSSAADSPRSRPPGCPGWSPSWTVGSAATPTRPRTAIGRLTGSRSRIRSTSPRTPAGAASGGGCSTRWSTRPATPGCARWSR